MERWGSLPAEQRAALAPYRALYESYGPADARYLSLHQGHLLYVRPDERPFVTGEAIAAGSFTATAPVLRERIERLAAAGYHQLAIQLVHGHESAIEDWARLLLR